MLQLSWKGVIYWLNPKLFFNSAFGKISQQMEKEKKKEHEINHNPNNKQKTYFFHWNWEG